MRTNAVLACIVALALQGFFPAYALAPKQEPVSTVAIVTTVISLGKGLADYFSGQESKKEQAKQLELINQQLVEINRRLDDINTKLDTVLEELRALSLQLNESFDRDERTRLLAVVRLISNDYSTWSQNPAIYKQEAKSALQALEIESNNVMLRKTASNFETAAFAMLMEKDMFVLLKSDAALMKRHFTAYEDYFKMVSDPQSAGSVGEAVVQISSRIDQLTSSLQRGPFWCHVGSQYKKCCGDGQNCEYNTFQRVVGDFNTAFDLSGSPIEFKTGGPGPSSSCHSHPPIDRPDRPGRSSLFMSRQFIPESIKTRYLTNADVYGQPGSEGCPAPLNAIRTDRLDAIQKLGGLKEANKVAMKFAEIAHNLAAGADETTPTGVVGPRLGE